MLELLVIEHLVFKLHLMSILSNWNLECFVLIKIISLGFFGPA